MNACMDVYVWCLLYNLEPMDAKFYVGMNDCSILFETRHACLVFSISQNALLFSHNSLQM